MNATETYSGIEWTNHEVVGHFLHWGTKLQHIVRYERIGPAAIHRQTICGQRKAVLVDSSVIDKTTREMDPDLVRRFVHQYTNGWPDFADPEPYDQENWCPRCFESYVNRRVREKATS